MDMIQHLLLWAVLVVCCLAERQYFLQSNSSTWEQARLHCQVCYKELVSLTPDNNLQLVQNLNSSYWIGLRKTIRNDSYPWSSWSNGDPLTFQNWYPGHPVLSKPNDHVMKVNYGSSLPNECGCSCTNENKPTNVTPAPTAAGSYNDTGYGNDTDDPFPEDENMTTLSMMEAMAKMKVRETAERTTMATEVTTMTSEMTTGPTFFTGVTGGISGTNETDTDENQCIALYSFGLWFDQICSKPTPYICYEDRFYGNATMTNKTLHSGTLHWTRGPGDISDYRVEVNSSDYNLTLNHSNLNRTYLTYDLSNLTAGTQYKVQVFPIKCGRDLNPQNVSFYTKPDVIKYLDVTKVSETNIALSWSAPEGNRDFYYIQVRGQPHLKMTTHTESAVVKGLIPGGYYTFDVNAKVEDESIEGDPLNISSYTKPGKVSNLNVSDPTADSVHLQWEQPAGNISGFRVDVLHEENVNNKTLKYIDLNNTSLRVTELPAGAKLWLSVVALVPDAFVKGEPSTVIAFTSPGGITDLELVPATYTINVTWTAPTGNYETFSVQLNLTALEQEVEKKEQNASPLSFTGLKAGAEYTVTVTTLNGYLKSQPSSTTVFTFPVHPEPAKIDSFSESHVTLSWGAPKASQGVELTYLVKYTTEFWNLTKNVIVKNATTYIFHGLHAGTNYDFEVRVKAGTQESSPVTVSQMTIAKKRVLTITMKCSSIVPLHCEDIRTQTEVLSKLQEHFRKEFYKKIDIVFWELDWREA
ncbi:receptor-type tyrosine-protein phosphatase eta-like [Oncorhynchus kisutch]|uniref:receptor-type tyrosine-protein phosphatase eta-like n=1 Tax=Oncorhynchus kisutch TaxID=8019 RepID=UPI0012DF6486|nr:receptor-type tyrosine-protein phosphatase eta-like [Oncorhynchus kisutch]